VPAIFLTPGDGPYEGATAGVSDSLHSALWSRYHQPDDEWDERFPFAGLARYAALAATLVRQLDEADSREAVAATYRRMGNSDTGPVGSR
jgi:hypothetical protein